MNAFAIYLVNLLITLIAAIMLTLLLKGALKNVLLDLCGTAERAHFWTLFAMIMLIAMPVVIGMGFIPEELEADALFFELMRQLSGNLLGYLFTLAVVGGVISVFSIFAPRRPASQ